MASTFSIHPKIGVARLGNSATAFYLGPETTGGLPIECDTGGNPIIVNGQPKYVEKFKDATGGIKRQAAQFKICEHLTDGTVQEVTLQDPRIAKITWTAHVANKKPIWFHIFGIGTARGSRHRALGPQFGKGVEQQNKDGDAACSNRGGGGWGWGGGCLWQGKSLGSD